MDMNVYLLNIKYIILLLIIILHFFVANWVRKDLKTNYTIERSLWFLAVFIIPLFIGLIVYLYLKYNAENNNKECNENNDELKEIDEDIVPIEDTEKSKILSKMIITFVLVIFVLEVFLVVAKINHNFENYNESIKIHENINYIE